MSRSLLIALRPHRMSGRATVDEILTRLGKESFGWTILFFALINMIPLPVGSTLVLAPPLLLITAQMAIGLPHVRLPELISRRKVPVAPIRALVIRARRFTRPIERFMKPRYRVIFGRLGACLSGIVLFVVAFALFLPLPGTGMFPASALAVSALALVERDGLLLMIGLTIGFASIAIAAVLVAAIISGIHMIL